MKHQNGGSTQVCKQGNDTTTCVCGVSFKRKRAEQHLRICQGPLATCKDCKMQFRLKGGHSCRKAG